MRLNAFLSHRRLVLTVALLIFAIPAWGNDEPLDRATLKGISEVRVLVEQIDPEVERDGLTRSQIQTDVELRLTQSGIKVGPSSMRFLYVNVYTWKPEVPSLYAYSLRAEFNQGFMLNRNPRIYSVAATWSVSAGGTVGTARVSNIRSAVTELVDRFISAYFEQNPQR